MFTGNPWQRGHLLDIETWWNKAKQSIINKYSHNDLQRKTHTEYDFIIYLKHVDLKKVSLIFPWYSIDWPFKELFGSKIDILAFHIISWHW